MVSAMDPEADMRLIGRHVRYVPEADFIARWDRLGRLGWCHSELLQFLVLGVSGFKRQGRIHARIPNSPVVELELARRSITDFRSGTALCNSAA